MRGLTGGSRLPVTGLYWSCTTSKWSQTKILIMRVVYSAKCSFRTKEMFKKLFYWNLSKERVIGKTPQWRYILNECIINLTQYSTCKGEYRNISKESSSDYHSLCSRVWEPDARKKMKTGITNKYLQYIKWDGINIIMDLLQ